MRKVAMYAATRNLYQDTIVSLKSLLYHTEMDKVYLLVEDDKSIFALPECVETINVKNQPYFPEDGANYKFHCTYMALVRAIAWNYIDELTVLHMDFDTLVRKDVTPLFETDLTEKYFAAVKEPNKNWRYVPDYFNIGVTLQNYAEMWSLDSLLQTLLNTCKGYYVPDQDLLSILCKGAIVELPNIYNACAFTGTWDNDEVVIRHFAGSDKKSFYSDPDYERFLTMTWEEVMRGEKEHE